MEAEQICVGQAAPASCGTAPERGARPDGDGIFDTPTGRWWVLHTRSRHEKVIADALEKQRVLHYLPLVRTQRTYGRRRVTIRVPLFPGYLFLCGGVPECDLAWRTRRVAKILEAKDQQQLRRELKHIYAVVESGRPVDLYPALRAGRRCRVKWGALRGVEGVVVRRRSACRMYIAATMLGQSAVIEIDAAILEAID